METYIAILRGINITGHHLIRMDDLKALAESQGLINVSTYIQSGNLVFGYEQSDHEKLAGILENSIRQKFGFQVPVIIRTISQMVLVYENNPFVTERQENIDKLYVTFFAKLPSFDSQLINYHNEFLPDEFIISTDRAYVLCQNGYGTTKINNQFFENKLKVTATTRNWKTVRQLVNMAQNRVS